MDPPDECHLEFTGQCQSSDNKAIDCPSSDWYQPPLPYDVTVDGTYYSHVTAEDVDCTNDAWSDVCTKEFCDRQDDAIVQANTVMSIPYIISACLSPILGGFVDRYGLRAVIATIAPASLVVVHTLMAATDVDPIGTHVLTIISSYLLLTFHVCRSNGWSRFGLFRIRCSLVAIHSFGYSC